MRPRSPPPSDQRSATATPSAPSATVTATAITPLVVHPESRAPDGTLRLRGGPVEDRRVKWDEDVVDNEGMGKKSSKVCCIYRRPRAYDESSDSEDSSDSSSDDDSDSEKGQGGADGKKSGGCGHDHGKARRKVKPNAYERMPKYKR